MADWRAFFADKEKRSGGTYFLEHVKALEDALIIDNDKKPKNDLEV